MPAPARWEFEGPLHRPEGVGTWTYVDIPRGVVDEAALRPQTRVRGTIDGVEFRSSLMAAGGGDCFLVVARPIRDQIGKSAGQKVQVQFALDSSPRRIPLPRDFRTALSANSRAKQAFRTMAPSHRTAYVRWIEEARQPATRRRRIAEAIRRIASGATLK